MAMSNLEETRSIVPAHLAVDSMRDTGYRNAAYAVAELMDNSLQAGAGNVELICREESTTINQRERRRLTGLAVLDDGSGMGLEELWNALQFGNGAYRSDRSGIGRFGMGLPSSSLSQAKKVEVWSWQDGVESALYSYLDLDSIQNGSLTVVPKPVEQQIPPVWREAIAYLRNRVAWPESGTLVLWSKLDRCSWRTGRALIKNSEYLIGRMYRRALNAGTVRIGLSSFTESPDKGSWTIKEVAVANDPLYLMSKTSTPGQWGEEPMFEAHGHLAIIPVKIGGLDTCIKIRFSVAKKAAREGHNPGAEAHGKHASKNVGVSIMRADRELELQVAGWTNTYDPTERWWGCEVDIPTELDEVFGVTNNKQSATALQDYASHSLMDIADREGFDSEQSLKAAWKQDADPRLAILEVKSMIEANLSALRRLLGAQTRRSKSGKKRHASSAERKGTEATKKRQEEGFQGTSDAGEKASPKEREEGIREALQQAGLDEFEAANRAQVVVGDARKFEFVHTETESPAFFTVRPKSGVILIQLNTNHPAHTHLLELLEDSPDDSNIDALRTRMERCYDGLKLLLEAWARYEDEVPDGAQKDRLQDIRGDWGKIARDFLRED